MVYGSLAEMFADIAGAIREKEDSPDPIPACDFAERIRGLNVSPPPGLEELSWSEISRIAKSGQAQDIFSLGELKSINFGGTTCYVQIIGFDHDDVADAAIYGRDKAGITFQFGVAGDVNRDGVYSGDFSMNDSAVNTGGWRDSKMRNSRMPEMRGYMPPELQAVLVKVNKTTGMNYMLPTTEKTEDDLFLLSEMEYFGVNKFSVPREGTRYAFYAEGGNYVRYRSGSPKPYWTRSVQYTYNKNFCYVTDTGVSGGTAADSGACAPTFAFCV